VATQPEIDESPELEPEPEPEELVAVETVEDTTPGPVGESEETPFGYADEPDELENVLPEWLDVETEFISSDEPESLEEEPIQVVLPGPETLKPHAKTPAGQAELSFDAGPRGRFAGESPNLVDGDDLDIPPFLRKKR
jgi:cell division protein FtsZ